ncbi:MAG: sulfate permease [Proteobacteria bacterium]|nr:sulfate permease [Pseudomonadota bacterium]
MAGGLARHLPILDWGRGYDRATLTSDLVAAVVVTVMLIPQSLAYATLAGLPAQMGLYASIAPLVAYALFGTSRTMAIGPVAVVSLMTAAAASRVAGAGSPQYVEAALILALTSGVMMLAMGLLRMGGLAKLLSNPVVNGFTVASSVIIAASQIGPLIGVKTSGQTLYSVAASFAARLGDFNAPTAIIGIGALAFLFWVRKGLKPLLIKLGLKDGPAGLVAKTGPVLAIVVSTLAVSGFNLGAKGVRTVGAIPIGLPPLTPPPALGPLWIELALPALFISIIGFVSSISVAQALAAKRRQRIDPSQELVGLGVSNVAAALTGGFPITGGFARSVVNYDAGAETPAAGAFTAVGLAVAALTLTPLLHDLPVATLAATIIVAVLSLIDFADMVRVWRYSRRDFAAMAATIAVTLAVGVEAGLATGVGLSILLYLHRASNPHVAVVGQVPGSQHFRNVDRHDVITAPEVLNLRIDESLTFTNAAWLEETVLALIAEQPDVRDVVLMCSAVNDIDASALESLKLLNLRLKDAGVRLHLSEVKGPVMDRLRRSSFADALTGRVFLSQYEAFRALAPGVCDSRSLDRAENLAGEGI